MSLHFKWLTTIRRPVWQQLWQQQLERESDTIWSLSNRVTVDDL